MKILRNIIPAIKLYYALRYLHPYKKSMHSARIAGDDIAEQKAILGATDCWGRNVLRMFDVNLTIVGAENLPKEGPVVYVSNHLGYGDIPTYCAALNTIQFGFIARDDLGKIPVYGTWIKNVRSVMMNREDARSSLRSIEEGIELIKRGFSLLIFPEGTRSKGGPIQEFKRGSLRLATKAGVPVIPLTMMGTSQMFEERGIITKGAQVKIVIHPPIETAGMEKSRASNLAKEVEDIVKSSYVGV